MITKKDAQANPQHRVRVVAIITMFFLFAMIAFVTNLAAPLGTVWKGHYAWAGMIGNLMNFAAYLFMGIPAGKLLQRIGYKKTALWALALGFIGMGAQYLSSLAGGDTAVFNVAGNTVMLNYIIYLTGAFIGGFCVCMLNTVVNPMLTLLGGGGNKGNQLLQTGGSLNSLSATFTPILVGMLVGQVTEHTSMTEVVPLLWIAMGVFVLSFIVISFVSIPNPDSRSAGKRKAPHSAWNFRHTVLGVIGIFFYVGIEVGIPGILIFYLSDSDASGITVNATSIATAVAAIYWMLMLVGRLVSSVISGKVSSKAQLSVATSAAIVLVVAAIFVPSTIRLDMIGYSVEDGFTTAAVPLSAFLLVLTGLFTSVMWGGIFSLAVEGLGRYTAQASGMFMMMVCGGGIMPLIQESMARNIGYMASYWLVAAMLAYLLYYAVAGCRNVNKSIPTAYDANDFALNQ